MARHIWETSRVRLPGCSAASALKLSSPFQHPPQGQQPPTQWLRYQEPAAANPLGDI